ncbi:protein kinase family protein [Leekyejoonella antrihumi]|uniref:Protein kinase domain-containing protein n=1 Tax=Leekyejoonella antrihumi TaxID=1660198 RepID=A0A563E7M9_9MICO|nr:protein kinase family protein [Leekyejoonella antrihumi]TWP38263.1 hypothetical protein FGL98_03350 [Leekyejoonella antrihumi]
MQGISQGTTLAGRYTLTRRLAEQHAGEQWLAADTTLDREVSVTVFPTSGPYAEAALDSARRAAGVEDHHLLRVLDVGSQGDLSFVIAEALHGAESVAAIVAFDTIPAEEARRMIGETASGLNTAAARGLHHLQLSPHDIMRSRDGSVSVLGVATDAALAGLEDVPSDEASRSDAVALVQVLYAALTGTWPGEQAVPGLLRAKRRADGVLPAPSELVTGVPGDLDTLCRTTLNADEGPRTPGELARQLSPWSSERVHGAGGRPALHGGAASSQSRSDQGDASHRPAAAVGGVGILGAAGVGLAKRGAGDDTDTGAHDPLSAWPQFADDDTRGGRPAGFDSDDTATFNARDARERGRPTRYDENSDLEPPVPLLQTGTSEPDHGTSRLALAIVAVFVVLAMILGFIGLSGAFSGRSSPKAGSTPSASTASPASSSKASTPTTPAAGKPITVAGITSFDPEGNGNEHNELAHLAIDGNPQTEWVTHIYGTATFGGIKGGTGLILNLGSKKQVGSVKLSIDGESTTMDVYVTNSPSIKNQTPFGSVKNGSGNQTVTGAAPTTGQYVIVWITKLSQRSPNTYRDKISEIKVLS